MMMKEFAGRSPKAATTLIYAAGYTAGSLVGILIGYLFSGSVKTTPTLAFGAGFGGMALYLARRRGLVPEPQELNQPISLFGCGGFQDESRK